MIPSANPFFHRTPIREPVHFFGRKQELQQIGMLVAQGQSVSLIGPRRIGKSSLLHQLCQPAMQAMHGLAETYKISYVSGEGWQDQSAQVLYGALWAAISDSVTATTAPGLLPTGLPDATVEALDFPTFQRSLRRLNRAGFMLILILDEFDALSRNRNLDEVFFSSLRSLAASHGVTFVTASTVPLLELTYAQQSALSSPFFNIFLPQRLELLTNDEAAELVVGTAALGGLAMTEQQRDEVVKWGGPHPFFLQIVGYHWWEAGQPAHIAEQITIRQAIEHEAFAHWAYLWRYLSPAEQRMLALLSVVPELSSQTQQKLHHACLLRSGAQGSIYLSPLLERFIQQQQVHGVIKVGPLLLDQAHHLAWLEHEPLPLAPQDFRLLEILATEAGSSLSYTDLAAALWPDEQTAINHQLRLKAAIRSLRRRLGQHSGLITTDPAGGYGLQG